MLAGDRLATQLTHLHLPSQFPQCLADDRSSNDGSSNGNDAAVRQKYEEQLQSGRAMAGQGLVKFYSVG